MSKLDDRTDLPLSLEEQYAKFFRNLPKDDERENDSVYRQDDFEYPTAFRRVKLEYIYGL